MAKWKKAAHVVYQCSYHLVWTPKYRYRILQGEMKNPALKSKLDPQKITRCKPCGAGAAAG